MDNSGVRHFSGQRLTTSAETSSGSCPVHKSQPGPSTDTQRAWPGSSGRQKVHSRAAADVSRPAGIGLDQSSPAQPLRDPRASRRSGCQEDLHTSWSKTRHYSQRSLAMSPRCGQGVPTIKPTGGLQPRPHHRNGTSALVPDSSKDERRGALFSLSAPVDDFAWALQGLLSILVWRYPAQRVGVTKVLERTS